LTRLAVVSIASILLACVCAAAPASAAGSIDPAALAEQAAASASLTGAPAASTPVVPTRAPAWDVTLRPEPSKGGRLVIEGRILGEDGRPRRDAKVRVHHTLPGTYICFPEDPKQKPSGLVRTNVLGEYRVRTRLPGLAEGVPHVHFEFDSPDGSIRAIALRLGRAAGAGSDSAFASLPWMATTADPGYWGLVTRDASGDYFCRWDLPMAKLLQLPPEEVAGRHR